jgi:hypothetical protein
MIYSRVSQNPIKGMTANEVMNNESSIEYPNDFTKGYIEIKYIKKNICGMNNDVFSKEISNMVATTYTKRWITGYTFVRPM